MDPVGLLYVGKFVAPSGPGKVIRGTDQPESDQRVVVGVVGGRRHASARTGKTVDRGAHFTGRHSGPPFQNYAETYHGQDGTRIRQIAIPRHDADHATRNEPGGQNCSCPL